MGWQIFSVYTFRLLILNALLLLLAMPASAQERRMNTNSGDHEHLFAPA